MQPEPSRNLPLAGIRVLDLSRILAGPWATMTLGDLGAEVWKIEQPGSGDDTRAWAPPLASGIATYYLAANRNKMSLTIDLSKKEGREIIMQLAARADIVVENFRPSSLRKLRLTHEDFHEVNPRLIHCSISGYGRDNPLDERPGYDFIMQAECGFMSITGTPEGDPMRLGVAFVDLISGMNATQAILAALYMRERTGVGQQLDIALSDSAFFFLANVGSGYLNTKAAQKRYGNAHPSIVPYQLFSCVGGQLALAVGNDEQFARFCSQILGLAELAADARFATNRARVENRDALLPIIAEYMSGKKIDEVVAALRRASIPAGEVKTIEDAFVSEPATFRDVVVSSPHPVLGEVLSVRSPLRFSAASHLPATAPPLLGEHTAEVLEKVLSFTSSDVSSLREKGIIG